jgi:hypothetical protein
MQDESALHEQACQVIRRNAPSPALGSMTVASVGRPGGTPPPLSPHAAAWIASAGPSTRSRMPRRCWSVWRRAGPLAKRPTLQAAIVDLDWTAGALSTALLARQEPAGS